MDGIKAFLSVSEGLKLSDHGNEIGDIGFCPLSISIL